MAPDSPNVADFRSGQPIRREVTEASQRQPARKVGRMSTARRPSRPTNSARNLDDGYRRSQSAILGVQHGSVRRDRSERSRLSGAGSTPVPPRRRLLSRPQSPGLDLDPFEMPAIGGEVSRDLLDLLRVADNPPPFAGPALRREDLCSRSDERAARHGPRVFSAVRRVVCG